MTIREGIYCIIPIVTCQQLKIRWLHVQWRLELYVHSQLDTWVASSNDDQGYRDTLTWQPTFSN